MPWRSRGPALRNSRTSRAARFVRRGAFAEAMTPRRFAREPCRSCAHYRRGRAAPRVRRNSPLDSAHVEFVERRRGARAALSGVFAQRAARTRASRFAWPSQPQRGLQEQWQFAGLSTSRPSARMPASLIAVVPGTVVTVATGSCTFSHRASSRVRRPFFGKALSGWTRVGSLSNHGSAIPGDCRFWFSSSSTSSMRSR